MLYQRFAKGIEAPGPDHNRLDWGTKMEPLLLEQAAADLRLEVKTNRQPDGSQIYLRRGLLGCSRDADIYDPQRGPGALETKCCFDYKILMQEWDGGKTPPRQHEIQLQQQMYVGDGDHAFRVGHDRAVVRRRHDLFPPQADAGPVGEVRARGRSSFSPTSRRPRARAVRLAGRGAAAQATVRQADRRDHQRTEKLGEVEATKLAQRVVDAEYQRVQRLAAEKVEEKVKAELLGLLKDADEIELPQGIRVKIARSQRAGYSVKPTTVVSVKAHIPQQIDGGFGGI
jgi:hypothetical protein